MDHLTHGRRLNARFRAKILGLDPDELDFEEAEKLPTFSTNGSQKSVEITALIRLLERKWQEKQTGAKKNGGKK
ncbi:hypothetical protein QTH91_05895 [Variovorax dokdonensis]|uniref:Uncharacterized protein n=1 Tax=Variovorax dokdonensis TaxID=344883 RepID=A0ABT7N7U5_9BURK|nr:hypothetical protein [Variovorax dokdonensis]MDM0044006.1 hypothetical protein [Variovorax dokdonensis]